MRKWVPPETDKSDGRTLANGVRAYLEPIDELPILKGPRTNGEYVPPSMSALEREAQRRARAMAEDAARRQGMDRRVFLRTVCGAAVSLLALDACNRDSARERGREAGGRFDVPSTSATDADAARDAIAGDEAIVDVQGHLLDYTINPNASRTDFGRGFPQARCGEADARDCFSIEHFLESVFLESDTNAIVLSSIPVAADVSPLTMEVMEETRRVAAAVCGDGRIHLQAHAVPNAGRLEAALEDMERVAAEHEVKSWKVYTHALGPGWTLDDSAGLRVGEAVIRKAVETGVKMISVHKGLSGGDRFASPADIGPAAARHSDVNFVVYHSGYEAGGREGPFDPDAQHAGVDRLIASVQKAGVAAGSNVYAELGSTWFNLMRSPEDAAHVLGKLLVHVGADNILWGTDSIWYGSPQDQIQAFRSFTISEQLQELHGYPALTPEVKKKILGGNAMRLYGIEVPTERCDFTRRELEEIRAGR